MQILTSLTRNLARTCGSSLAGVVSSRQRRALKYLRLCRGQRVGTLLWGVNLNELSFINVLKQHYLTALAAFPKDPGLISGTHMGLALLSIALIPADLKRCPLASEGTKGAQGAKTCIQAEYPHKWSTCNWTVYFKSYQYSEFSFKMKETFFFFFFFLQRKTFSCCSNG